MIALLAALVVTACAPAFAGFSHEVCAPKHHDCGKPRIAECCCGDQVPVSAQSTPASSRIDVRPDSSAMPVLPGVLANSVACIPSAAVSTSPPRFHLIDRPTLYSFLLL
jgi:hypothetical protein